MPKGSVDGEEMTKGVAQEWSRGVGRRVIVYRLLNGTTLLKVTHVNLLIDRQCEKLNGRGLRGYVTRNGRG